uniref:ATP synthase F0 subunit 8 n=1 Tax=Cyanopterus ninghais TaxID=3079913 RepID=A0AA96Q9M1_9HYME|nr:ATP synthase F0 subunit 8 [Cyanopterus ninghais]
MPQMSPMDWLFLSLFFLLIYFIVFLMTYFYMKINFYKLIYYNKKFKLQNLYKMKWY